MKKRNLPKNSNRSKIRRERDPIPWRYCFLTLVCGVLLVGGFFLAARSHFSSIDFGIKNSSLKKQIEELEAEKRRLLLSKEIALSPSEIKKAARKLGFIETGGITEAARPKSEKAEKPQAFKTALEKSPVESKTAETRTPETKTADRTGKTGVQKDKPAAVKKETKPATQIARK